MLHRFNNTQSNSPSCRQKIRPRSRPTNLGRISCLRLNRRALNCGQSVIITNSVRVNFSWNRPAGSGVLTQVFEKRRLGILFRAAPTQPTTMKGGWRWVTAPPIQEGVESGSTRILLKAQIMPSSPVKISSTSYRVLISRGSAFSSVAQLVGIYLSCS